MTNEEIKKEILHRVAVQKKKRQRVLRVSASVGCAAVVALAGVGLVRSGVFDHPPPVTDTVVKPTTTVTTVPTEQESTTTTANTPTTNTTTDGGVVVPTTTVTTVAPTTTTTVPTPCKPTATKAPTTEPTKTTTTTSETKDKLLITGVETIDDDTLDQMHTGLFKPGEISPLLKQAMEQYKDTDAVYAVLVAINPKYNQKLVEDFNEAVDALLQSDEMVKLAEQRDLAREEWQAIDEERKAHIGDDAWAAEFLADYVTKEETYRSLRSEYDKRQHDFKLAYWQARADEAVEVLAKSSDMELIPLETRWNESVEKNEKAVLSYVLNAAYNTEKASGQSPYYGYAAILSANEILELSECGSYMFWLDSYDEEAHMDYLNDWV